MLEYFAIKHLTQDKETFEVDQMSETTTNLVVLIISVSAAYLAYEKNAHETVALRIAYTLLAFLFANIYIIYYFIRYVVMGDGSRPRGGKGKKRGGKGKGRGKRR